eukprot:CAMPEP_0181228012 /NCGR_PEP_ID=MMETSP1096-20121128/33112_1 /TAXON_ID=156174 ORGANISM="Chrysochromulina ericina, Strain CCMP281" /NCGR_SAMPLE_ID=MMETSP1096 /ASSEMBLY_ACC=CAM_ASM_000453 /LENGTH=71 /DNA_ID=CAMNT_0023321491 /DNA_START=420 /DNA_END=631 /DNA_ORIENTATION=-
MSHYSRGCHLCKSPPSGIPSGMAGGFDRTHRSQWVWLRERDPGKQDMWTWAMQRARGGRMLGARCPPRRRA